MGKKPAPHIVPEFGPLSGVRVLSTGSIVAMPHAATMLAEFGAEVIHVERPGVGDTYRTLGPFIVNGNNKGGTGWMQDARNRLSIGLEVNLNIPEAKEIFYGLIKQSDIWMENLVWLDKLGISDEEVLKVNPRIVIVHVSGYGHEEFGGLPEFCDRASYDMIGQSFSGFLMMQGSEGTPPPVAKPWTNDYISGIHAAFGALIAYVNAVKTGKGQVVDVAQYEANARWLCHAWLAYSELGMVGKRAGNKAVAFQPYDVFMARDKYVAMGAFGPAVYKRAVQALGEDPDYYTWIECSSSAEAVSSPKGQELDKKFQDFITARTAEEVSEHFAKFKVPCAVVQGPAEAMNHPHFISRNNFIEWEDQTVQKKVKGFGVIPHLSETPGKVWRGAPTIGQDTDVVLKELLGYSDADIAAFRDKKVI